MSTPQKPADLSTSDELDLELIRQLNEKYGAEEPQGLGVDLPRRSGRTRMIGFITAVAFFALLFSNWFYQENLPSLAFVRRSWELSRIPEIQQLREAVVEIRADNSRGTGFNIDGRGVIVTNYHVVADNSSVLVNFRGGKTYRGSVQAIFPEYDLAFIGLEGEGLPRIEVDWDAALAAGDEVMIIGNPLQFTGIITEGEVIGTTVLAGWDMPVLLIEAPIHKGNSGSPVLTRDGKAVAVVFALLAEKSGQKARIGLAVPLKTTFYP